MTLPTTIKSADMPDSMREEALEVAQEAMNDEDANSESTIAEKVVLVGCHHLRILG